MNKAKQFSEKAVRASRNRRDLAHKADVIASRIMEQASRIDMLSPKAVTAQQRQDALTEVWAAYHEVQGYLESSAPQDLDSIIQYHGDISNDYSLDHGTIVAEKDFQGAYSDHECFALNLFDSPEAHDVW